MKVWENDAKRIEYNGMCYMKNIFYSEKNDISCERFAIVCILRYFL